MIRKKDQLYQKFLIPNMEQPTLPICPKCKSSVQDTYKFCPNCGQNLQELRHVTWDKQIVVYFVSLFLPPFGIVYAMRYLKSPNQQVKWVGIIAVLLTGISLAVTVWIIFDITRQVQDGFSKYSNLGL